MRILAAIALCFCLLWSPATAAPLKAGDAAPLLETLPIEKATSTTLVLLFIKEDDSYSLRVVEQLKELRARNVELMDQAKVVIVLSRTTDNQEFALEISDQWKLHRDTEDTLYRAYRIIATPTAVVISNSRVLGFHPGYSSGLIRMIQRDLLLELRGREALRTQAPPVSAELQMGRRLFERNLPERALPYYIKADEKEGLAQSDLADLARIYIQMKKNQEAEQIIGQIVDTDESKALRELLKETKPGATPPRVQ